MPGHGYVSTGTSKRCGQCQTRPPAFDYVVCQYRYQPPISHWVLKMKDKRQFIWAEKIAQLMQQSPPTMLNKVDQIVFIPSHPLHRFQRGFNPAEWIALELSRAFAIPLVTNALIKGSGKDQRQVNLQNSLRKGSAQLTGQHILIIDDVMTTGATLDVAASLLKQQGARLVGAWVFARTPKYDFSNSHP
ncbi:ComF family protein [Bacterioplanoides sp.]|uniref:ComF family protein n=1 Tax=Bacterioplanoides sp. TaxID=2066072 RepID=UPI003AFF8CA0